MMPGVVTTAGRGLSSPRGAALWLGVMAGMGNLIGVKLVEDTRRKLYSFFLLSSPSAPEEEEEEEDGERVGGERLASHVRGVGLPGVGGGGRGQPRAARVALFPVPHPLPHLRLHPLAPEVQDPAPKAQRLAPLQAVPQAALLQPHGHPAAPHPDLAPDLRTARHPNRGRTHPLVVDHRRILRPLPHHRRFLFLLDSPVRLHLNLSSSFFF